MPQPYLEAILQADWDPMVPSGLWVVVIVAGKKTRKYLPPPTSRRA